MSVRKSTRQSPNRKAAAKAVSTRSRSSRGRARGRRSGGSSLVARAMRRVALTFLTLLVGAVVWGGYHYIRTPKEDRSFGEIAGKALDHAENLYAKAPRATEPLKALPDLLPGRSDDGTTAPDDGEDSASLLLIARVKRVVDGDTLVVETRGREERVRLLRVDTPESVHRDAARNVPLGKAASEFTRKRLEGKQVRLRFASERNRTDRYGRLLCYVFLGERLFNVELVEQGYSLYYTRYGRSREFHEEFEAAERTAREHKRGVWADGVELDEEFRREMKKREDRRTERVPPGFESETPGRDTRAGFESIRRATPELDTGRMAA